MHILERKVTRLRLMDDKEFERLKEKNQLNCPEYTDFDIAMEIDEIMMKNKEKIMDQDVIRNLTDYLF